MKAILGTGKIKPISLFSPSYFQIILLAKRNVFQARKLLSTLDPLTNSDGISSKLERLFGNVVSGLSNMQDFFAVTQRDGETVTMWKQMP